ncbi:DUF5133 domain-containing protein [Streptomyces atroolivaceus]|uniref:DUF5133 domain-containing protein n=1 Tax=Streptomyces atroolivaceus TaxID=66869 RepID=UPI0037B64175
MSSDTTGHHLHVLLVARARSASPQSEELRASGGEDAGDVLRRIEDVSCTLCVSNGTRDVTAALVAVREPARGETGGVLPQVGRPKCCRPDMHREHEA